VRGADAAKRPQDGEHRLHALHCTHTRTHTHTQYDDVVISLQCRSPRYNEVLQ
jgi:hypothetical protein